MRSGRWYRVRATTAPMYAGATAVGIRRIARNRYAGARVDVAFEPECGPAAARDRALDDALARVVRRAAVGLQALPAR